MILERMFREERELRLPEREADGSKGLGFQWKPGPSLNA